ncbi:MAG: pantoate--beta-alanine ligase [Candidatus Omnitrophica bacterium]|nr:pantoate--beta-alanine ligase [Candidatus Omnitrophota bacterium]
MKLIRDPKKLEAILEQERRKGRSVGFVPTMGALHEGHLSLVLASNRQTDITVVSIFVNPTQFGPKEDLAKYPRPIRKDLSFLRAAKVDFVLMPSVGMMYPEGLAKPLRPSGSQWPRFAQGLCGKFRPGHFRGVATVVAKLLSIVGPCRLYLGAKDFQQVAVIRQLVRDLKIKAQVRVMPTVREKDGLAMSSRNRYLTSAERHRALAISAGLRSLRRSLLRKRGSISNLRSQAFRELAKNVDRVQYLEIVDSGTLVPVKKFQDKMAILTACFVGKTRLIDNVIIRTR